MEEWHARGPWSAHVCQFTACAPCLNEMRFRASQNIWKLYQLSQVLELLAYLLTLLYTDISCGGYKVLDTHTLMHSFVMFGFISFSDPCMPDCRFNSYMHINIIYSYIFCVPKIFGLTA